MNELTAITTVVTWPAAIFGVTYFLHKSGVFTYLVSGRNDRIEKLESFRIKAETNHFHDIEELKQQVFLLRRDFDDLRVAIENRLTRLETKVNGNGYTK